MARRRYPNETPLIEAVLNSDLKRVRQLLVEGADPNATSSRGEGALTAAARHPEIALALIDAGADVARADRGIINPVWAVATGRADVVAKVLDAGGELNCKTALGTPLHVAAREGRMEILRLLIERGADVNAGTSVGNPIYSAVEGNHTECVALLLQAGAWLQTAPHGRDTLLTRAVHNRNAGIVKALLAAGAPPDERGVIAEMDRETFEFRDLYTKATPLMIAARLGELWITDLLLQAGADPTLRDEDGKRPLDLAREQGHPEVAARIEDALQGGDAPGDPSEDLLLAAERGDTARIREALVKGADVNARDARSKSAQSTPLILAARHGRDEAVRLLLDAGADVALNDAGDEESVQTARWLYRQVDADEICEEGFTLGRSALHEAAGGGAAAIVEALLVAGALVDQPDILGRTPLMLAAEGGHPEVVRRLLAAGADPKATDSDKTGTLAAAVAGGSVECVELLLHAGAKIPGGKKQNLLMGAAIRGSAEIVEALVRAGAKVDAANSFGSTPLIEAAEAGHVRVVQRLIELGAEVNRRNDSGDTALIRGAALGVSLTEYEAVRERDDPLLYQKVEMARVLLDAGAEVDAVNDVGQGALAMAAFSLNEPLVRFLLDRGADPNVGNVAGTPLELARENHFAPDLIERLARAATPSQEAPEPAPPASEVPEKEPAEQEPELPELPLTLFSAALEQPEYRQALADLESWCGTRAALFEHAPGAFHLHVDTRSGFDFEAARKDLLARGYTLVWIDTLHHQQVGLFPTQDQFEVLYAMGTNGANYDLGPDDVIAWLRALHAEQPFEITGANCDVVAGRFLNDVREPRKLAKRMYEFCPDIVDQGTGSVAALALALQKDRSLYFWWD